MEFWRDKNLDNMMNEIVSIFRMEGVELVRVHGLAKYISKNFNVDMSYNELQNAIEKLKEAKIIDYELKTICPHCGEVFYILKDNDSPVKLCDTCKCMFTKQKMK